MEAIGRESERRIEGAADLWLSRQPDYGRLSMRFDMVAVLPSLAGRCMSRPRFMEGIRGSHPQTINAASPAIPTSSRHQPNSA
ncbi:hypothetical protein ACVOMV_06530 [Mesorhizobium atlanticum]